MSAVFPIDPDSSVPLTRQIYEFWRAGIVSGRFPRGERVPSTRDVAAALGISRGTVAEAYEQLMSEGYFQAVRGSGTYVCLELPEADWADIPGGESFRKRLTFAYSAERRNIQGGTGSASVRAQLAKAKRIIDGKGAGGRTGAR